MTSPGRFRALFGTAPTAVVRAPGRLNLIGEHIDYAGLPVLPMAIDRGITLAARARTDDRVRLVNARPELGGREFDIAPSIPPWPAGDWGNYAKAALQGLSAAGCEPGGFDAFVSSDLPMAAGLSSSSALVVATALAGLVAAGRPLPLDPVEAADVAGRLELAALLARAERYVGVRGGGMDQAAILAGRTDCVVRVDFEPLRVRPVAVPEGWAFVVAHSLAVAEKAGAARTTYNRRRAEVESALDLVARRLGTRVASYTELLAAHAVDELVDAGSDLPAPLAGRFRHVVTEARRVEATERRLRAGDAEGVGGLLLASHASLRDDFAVSTPALDALVDVAVAGGAHGARLTGAGLGGCVLALVPAARVESLLAELARSFYRPRGVVAGREPAFPVRPSNGAGTTRHDLRGSP